MKSYNSPIFTIKNLAVNKLPQEKIDKYFSATAHNKE